MTKILINDGIHPTGLNMLIDAGFEVQTENIPQKELGARIGEFDALCVRSATKVRQDLIEKAGKLKIIGRGGVGLDNIDVAFAESKGIKVINTPGASSRSVAELAMAHLFSIARSLYKSNRHMPREGKTGFKTLKKSFSKGFELQNKTLGIIGMGKIGQETAKLAIGIGMDVIGVDPFIDVAVLEIEILDQKITHRLKTKNIDDMLPMADFISIHVPYTNAPVLTADEFDKMKDGVVLLNASRGGVVNEQDLLVALDSGKVFAAGIDVYDNEPSPDLRILNHPNVSMTPHIGASTSEAQERIGVELAEKLIAALS